MDAHPVDDDADDEDSKYHADGISPIIIGEEKVIDEEKGYDNYMSFVRKKLKRVARIYAIVCLCVLAGANGIIFAVQKKNREERERQAGTANVP